MSENVCSEGRKVLVVGGGGDEGVCVHQAAWGS